MRNTIGRMSLGILIATKGRPGQLRTAMEHALASVPPPDVLLVVDGDQERSAEPVVEDLAGDGPTDVRYLASAPGLTRQRNLGLDAVGTDVVVFIDDDCNVEPSTFAHLNEAVASPGVVAATGRVLEPRKRRFGGTMHAPGRRFVLGRRGEGSVTTFGYPRRIVDVHSPADVEYLHGCLMAVRGDVGARVRFDERLAGYALGEDEDFGFRVSREGRVRYVPEAIGHHDDRGSASFDHRRFNRMVVVNRAYLFRKNHRPSAMSRLRFGLFLLVLAGHRALNREWQGIPGLAEGARLAWRTRRSPPEAVLDAAASFDAAAQPA